jgi:hypothetical protein
MQPESDERPDICNIDDLIQEIFPNHFAVLKILS